LAGRGRSAPARAASGEPLLFETYATYDSVTARSGELWRGFAGITLTSLLLLVVLLLPILWRVLDRLRRAQSQREAALARAMEASEIERQRIAATLHDGLVQELAATSFVVSGAALRAGQDGQRDLAHNLGDAAQSVRTSIGGLRSLLVDIYPPSLDLTGLVEALKHLTAGPRSRDIDVKLWVPDEAVRLDQAGERLVYRVAQECLRNAIRHSGAQQIALTLTAEENRVFLVVADDGVGFDPEQVLANPPDGHFGLRLLVDAVTQHRGRAAAQHRTRCRVSLAAGGAASMITVLLVDDHQLVRAGLQALLDTAADLEVVGQAADGEEALRLASELHPDVVLMDLSMPVLDGVEATRRLLKEQPDARVVVLTSFSESERVTEALSAGAIGYQLKDSDPQDLMAAVRAAADGNAPLDPRVTRALLPAARMTSPPVEQLSNRETEVLALVAQGLSNIQIARRLAISQHTVKVHITNVFCRIGVNDRTSAALWARDHLPNPLTSRPERSTGG
jgi:DNA-binding NarL/FixJ family response regulator